ncbi:MgtC/SapB family protein [Candidatus Micrarchaeota archaeon]|nr:MgtC/SapB family protein [Candidatus Micrarchaeota archaeon]
MIAQADIIIRFLAGAVVGLAIGFTRRHKPAGIRTFSLVCLGSVIFTVVALSLDGGTASVSYNIIAQIVSGIGFIGLGVIWKEGINKPTGLTTAAGLWVTAALGILIGLGMTFEAVVGTALTLAIVYSKKPLEQAHIEDEED